jgi:hypothetical protein
MDANRLSFVRAGVYLALERLQAPVMRTLFKRV